MELSLEEISRYYTIDLSVLDGELAVPCNLKSAICRVKFRRKGFADLNFSLKAVMTFPALRNSCFSESRQVWKEAAVGLSSMCRKPLGMSWL